MLHGNQSKYQAVGKTEAVGCARGLRLAFGGGFFTVRELITELVKSGVAQYHKKLEQPEILKCMTKEEIEDKAQSGKISFGVVYSEKKANLAHALTMRYSALRTAFTGFF